MAMGRTGDSGRFAYCPPPRQLTALRQRLAPPVSTYHYRLPSPQKVRSRSSSPYPPILPTAIGPLSHPSPPTQIVVCQSERLFRVEITADGRMLIAVVFGAQGIFAAAAPVNHYDGFRVEILAVRAGACGWLFRATVRSRPSITRMRSPTVSI
jgi:hypothetical protein